MSTTTIVSNSATILQEGGRMVLTILSSNTAAGVLAEKTKQALDGIAAAADTAMFTAGIFQDTFSGLADTAVGGYFNVLSGEINEFAILYRNVAGTAVEQKRFPGAALLQSALTAAAGAESSETNAANSEVAAQASQTAALISQTSAGSSASAAAASKVLAETAASAAAAAVSGSVNTFYASTKAAAVSMAGALGNGATVIVDNDESQGNARVRYTKTAGVLGSPVKHTASQVAVVGIAGMPDVQTMAGILASVAGLYAVKVNDIGVPGEAGFGVGICPSLFPGYLPVDAGTYMRGSPTYGNYRYTDSSVMVWVPAHYRKEGNGVNGLAVNRSDTKPLSHFADLAAANANGYYIPRAFYDDGAIQLGVFRDKYLCSNNSGTASSIRFGKPLSSASVHNPFSGLTGSPANTYGGAFAAAKTRGSQFFPSSGFIEKMIADLSKAHADASTTTANCAWYMVGANYPKGNNNNAFADANDLSVTFLNDGYAGGNSALAGSANTPAKTTHNGQLCGISDLNGNMLRLTPGLTSNGTDYFVLKTSVAMKSLTGGNTLSTDAFGATGLAANYDNIGGSYFSLRATGADRVVRYGNGAAQVFSEATSGNDWAVAGFGIPLAAGVSAGGTAEFGADYLYDYRPNECFPIAGGNWIYGAGAGVFLRLLAGVRGNANASVGFCSASFGS